MHHIDRQGLVVPSFHHRHNHGAGNPPNPRGLQPDWLGKEVLTPARLIDILENHAPIVKVKHPGDRQEEAHAGLPSPSPAGRGAAGRGFEAGAPQRPGRFLSLRSS